MFYNLVRESRAVIWKWKYFQVSLGYIWKILLARNYGQNAWTQFSRPLGDSYLRGSLNAVLELRVNFLELESTKTSRDVNIMVTWQFCIYRVPIFLFQGPFCKIWYLGTLQPFFLFGDPATFFCCLGTLQSFSDVWGPCNLFLMFGDPATYFWCFGILQPFSDVWGQCNLFLVFGDPATGVKMHIFCKWSCSIFKNAYLCKIHKTQKNRVWCNVHFSPT